MIAMKENFIPLIDGWFYIRHLNLDDNKPVLLFLHGLGESGLCFQEVFSHPAFQQYTIVVPDLIGYGRSSYHAQGDYSLSAQAARVWDLVEYLGLESFHLIGHSLGADLAVYMADADEDQQIKSVVSIEGDLTPQDVFFSDQAVKAADDGRFDQWFEQDFKEDLVLKQWGGQWASCRRYYASLQFARPDAFLANAREMHAANQIPAGQTVTELAALYAGLRIPKIYCWGGKSLAAGTQAHLSAAGLENRQFATAGHWLMIDQSEEFYSFLSERFSRL